MKYCIGLFVFVSMTVSAAETGAPNTKMKAHRDPSSVAAVKPGHFICEYITTDIDELQKTLESKCDPTKAYTTMTAGADGTLEYCCIHK